MSVQHKSSEKDLKIKGIEEGITLGDMNVKIEAMKNMQGPFLFAILFMCFSVSSCLRARMRPPVNLTFNVLDYGAIGNGQTDDSQAFLKAWKDVCEATQGSLTLLIPNNKTFMLQPVIFMGECKSSAINVKIEGSLIAPREVSDWKWERGDEGRWIHFSDIKGLLVDGRGLVDGQGAPWWDCFHESRCKRPDVSLLSFHRCENLQLKVLTHINGPKVHIHLDDCNGIHHSNLHVVPPQDSPNTDGIDISTTSNMIIQDSNIETGDDCIAINEGLSFINVTGVYCGPGHGISIGSLGSKRSHATVEDIHVRNCTFTRTSNGARIKTWKRGSGYARRITFRRYVGLHEVTAVEVSDITFRNFGGTSASEDAIKLECDDSRGCTDIVLEKINITSSDLGKTTHASCENARGTSSSSNVPDIDCLQW
ncbi:probable polygalacturonase At3g15720 [Prosopis cineraria]|uniref:probable polygalacturonase At3g15720 n=1 Tax=Prosopis cineraria TaxID=364024 RepID=UPI00240F23A9|nr:probable polygalacturonase At3g15720 [Prosopis cineraria]